MHQFSNMLFGLALGSALMMKASTDPNEMAGLTVFSVSLPAIMQIYYLQSGSQWNPIQGDYRD